MAKEFCVFCDIVNDKEPSHKIYADECVTAFLDINPASEWHILVIPNTHHESMVDLSTEKCAKVFSVVQKIVTALHNSLLFKEFNFNILSSTWIDAWQDIWHFHVHIIPRSKWDKKSISFYYKTDGHSQKNLAESCKLIWDILNETIDNT